MSIKISTDEQSLIRLYQTILKIQLIPIVLFILINVSLSVCGIPSTCETTYVLGLDALFIAITLGLPTAIAVLCALTGHLKAAIVVAATGPIALTWIISSQAQLWS